jgi:hypothetical protein
MILSRDKKGRIVKSTGILKTHGYAYSLVYKVWQGMWQRCINPRYHHYNDYGGRGIEINPEWGKFENFLRDMGPKPLHMSLDRINNNYGYEMNNCRWATAKQQANNRRNNING